MFCMWFLGDAKAQAVSPAELVIGLMILLVGVVIHFNLKGERELKATLDAVNHIQRPV
jgi:hypothetical protein